MPKLTRAQQQALAASVIFAVANLFEDWEHTTESGLHSALSDIPYDVARAQVAVWLGRLPGDAWDVRLPDPLTAKRTLSEG